ncbi:hypothetical protein KCU95_g4262, partial [Aureobasidium melanogenum]
MSHGGPLTMAQKRMMALRTGTASAAQSTTNAGPHNMPLLPAVYDHSSAPTSPRTTTDEQLLDSFGDIEMQDVSAPANYSHSRHQPTFSANAKPFVPPGVANTVASTMPAAISTPIKRLPPHRAMQAQPPDSSAAIPIVKPVPPAAPALTEQSAIASPARRAGPHSKLGPHARKADAPAQLNAPNTVQNDLIDVQQTKPDPDTWVGVQEPQVKTEAAQSEFSPVHHETQVKAEAEAVPIADQSATVDPFSSAGLQAPAAQQSVTPSNQMNRVARHLGRNKWLVMLDDMDDPETGRELILAIADHLRASVESREEMTAPEPNTVKEVFVEFGAGQCAPATVFPDMTVSEMIKECASLINVKESDIRIVLRISKGHGDQSQESEEL